MGRNSWLQVAGRLGVAPRSVGREVNTADAATSLRATLTRQNPERFAIIDAEEYYDPRGWPTWRKPPVRGNYRAWATEPERAATLIQTRIGAAWSELRPRGLVSDDSFICLNLPGIETGEQVIKRGLDVIAAVMNEGDSGSAYR